MTRAACLIVNPSAGRGRAARLLPRVTEVLRDHGVPFRVERTTSLEHARALARETLATGEVAAALGGDGLCGAVAGELDGSGVLAVLPGGRGNDFARKLGLGTDPVAAARLLRDGRERRVDVGLVGGRRFLGIASAGIDSRVQAVAAATRLPLGDLVYLYGALRALRSWRPVEWEIELDGRRRGFRGYAVAVANSGVYGGGMRLAPRARLDDGLLDVVLTGTITKRRVLLNLPRMYRGSHVREPGLEVVRAHEVVVSADRPFTAWADGDPVAALPTTASVLSAALTVLV